MIVNFVLGDRFTEIGLSFLVDELLRDWRDYGVNISANTA